MQKKLKSNVKIIREILKKKKNNIIKWFQIILQVRNDKKNLRNSSIIKKKFNLNERYLINFVLKKNFNMHIV